jgi:hypothetical protein
MKKIIYIIPIIVLMLLSGCGSKIKLPENPVVFETKVNDNYLSIVRDDKEYVPFCAVEPSQVGKCIGYYENDGGRIYVCELKGRSPDEWIVDVLSLDNCDEGMIFREKNTKEIPDGLSSDYEWNK